MPVILLEKDPFVEFENIESSEGGDFTQHNIRRPKWGFVNKPQRLAYLAVFQANNTAPLTPLSLKDSSARGGKGRYNHNFLIQNVQEQRKEKQQIIETFGEDYVFFFGESPIVMAVSGILLNTADFNWKNEFMENYTKYMRGTKCVENKCRVYFGYDDQLAQGYMLNCSMGMSSDNRAVVPFQFTLLLTGPPVDLAVPLVNNATEARDFDGNPTDTAAGEILPEYLSEIWENELIYELDPLTGEAVNVTGGGANAVGSSDAEKTAFWVAGKNPRKRAWQSSSEALRSIDANLLAQSTGRDARLLKAMNQSGKYSFSMGSQSPVVQRLGASLGKAMNNSGGVVPASKEVP